MADVWPPRKALALAAVLTAALAASVALAWWWGGVGLAVAAAIGAVGMLAMAARKAPLPAVGAFVALTAVLAALADAAADHALGLAILVVASALAATPFTIRFGPVGAALPVVVLVVGAQLHGVGPWRVAAVVVAMAAVLAGLVIALKVPRLPGTPVPRRVAWTHAIVLATLAGAATYLVLDQAVGHGVWIVFGLSAVLVPDVDATVGEAHSRIVGTLVGGLAAAVIATALPAAVALACAIPALMLAIAHAVAGQRRRFAGYATAVVVLVAGASLPDQTWDIALTRVAFIAAGALLAALAARAVVSRVAT